MDLKGVHVKRLQGWSLQVDQHQLLHLPHHEICVSIVGEGAILVQAYHGHSVSANDAKARAVMNTVLVIVPDGGVHDGILPDGSPNCYIRKPGVKEVVRT